jgi:beta-galactosidase
MANSIVLSDGWEFIKSKEPFESRPSEKAGAWQNISIPHCWDIQGAQNGGQPYVHPGPAWYRRRFQIPATALEGRLFLRFDAVATMASVFVNGTHVGKHAGAFSAFCFDITSHLFADLDNLLEVCVDNSLNAHIPPISGDFTIFGGIYRPVTLLFRDRISLDQLDDASGGILFHQQQVDAGCARLRIVTRVRNDRDCACTVNVRCTVRDHQGNKVQQVEKAVELPADKVIDLAQEMRIDSPRLWNGLEDPYLYQATVEVLEGERVLDCASLPLGLCSWKVDPEQGVLLNGKPHFMRGVGRHQDFIHKGWAIGEENMSQDVDLILEMGCNSVRVVHYQHSSDFYGQCDRAGLAAWAELGVNACVTDSQAFDENASQQLRELIKQNFNHPSIFCWSLFNELHFYEVQYEHGVQLVRKLDNLARELDGTRPTAGASCDLARHADIAPIPDIIGWNGYPGWYPGTTDWNTRLAELRKRYPGHCLMVSEYGAGASILHHSDTLKSPKTTGHFHPEEWQAFVHESQWQLLIKEPALVGSFIWCMFDFASSGRMEGDSDGRNDKGLVTYDRCVRKDAFFFYKANWSRDAVIAIASRRFTPRPAGQVTVKVYSNLEQMELFMDGQSLGTRTPDGGVAIWSDVSLQVGSHHVEALGKRGESSYRDECTWSAV